MKKITFTMSVIYDEDETYANNALWAIEHEMFNIEGIKEWNIVEQSQREIEWEEDEE